MITSKILHFCFKILWGENELLDFPHIKNIYLFAKIYTVQSTSQYASASTVKKEGNNRGYLCFQAEPRTKIFVKCFAPF